MRRLLVIICSALFLYACGGASSEFSDDIPTQAPPTVSRVEPAAGPPGTTITVYGFGFSINTPVNIVIIGGAAASATEHRFLDNPTGSEIESLTATVPPDATNGESSVVVVVYDNASNTDVQFTVTP